MKECPNCKNKYSDEFSFCKMCGKSLVSVSGNKYKEKKSMIIGMCIVVIVAVWAIGSSLAEQIHINNEKQAIEESQNAKALKEYKMTPTTSDLRVNSDWRTRKDRGYIYINGSVTNTSSSKTISYFEVEAKFYDFTGNVIDSDWTNDGDDLEPGETRQFEIMHKYNSNTENIKLSIKDVS